MDIINTSATMIYEDCLGKLIKVIKEQFNHRKLNISYKGILGYISKNIGNINLDSLIPHLRVLGDDGVNIDYEYAYIKGEIKRLSGKPEREAEDYTDYIFEAISRINRNAGYKIDNFSKERNEKIEKTQAEIQKEKELQELQNIITEAMSSYHKNYTYHTISEVESNLTGITGGMLDFSFFDGLDAVFEGKFKRLIEKKELVIEVHSGCRREAFLYVLKLLSECGYEDRVKIINSPDKWNDFPSVADDILVSDFSNPKEVEPRHNCINIRIHERTSSPQDKDNENYLMVRSRSALQMKKRLQALYETTLDAQKEGDKLFDKTNGYYSLIEAELGKFEISHSWETVKPYSEELKCLEQFLVISSFSKDDYDVLERNGFSPDKLSMMAEIIDWQEVVPLFTEDKRRGRYSLNAPDILWCVISQRDNQFSRFFIAEAKKLLSDSLLSSGLVNNILYSFIRHYPDFDPYSYLNEGKFSYSDEKLFDDVAPGLLRRTDRRDIIKAVTELCPGRMLNWFKENPDMISDENAEAIILLMHDSSYSSECAELVINNLMKTDKFDFCLANSIENIAKEFIRPVAATTGITAEKTIEIINNTRNDEILKDLVFEVLPRRNYSWFPCCVYYRYRDYVKKYHRSNEDAVKLADYEIKWFLDRADLRDLTAFIKNVDFVFFDFYIPLSSAFKRVIETSSEEERMPLYLELFSLNRRYEKWPETCPEKQLGLLEECLRLITPTKSSLEIAPLFSWASNFDDIESSVYVDKLLKRIKENNVPFADYLRIPSFVGSQLMQAEYFAVLVDNYDVEEAVSLKAYEIAKDTNSRWYYLDCVRRKLGRERLDGLFELLDDEERFCFIQSVQYSYAKDLLLQLPRDKQNEYWRALSRFRNDGLNSEEKKYALDKLIEVGNNDVIYQLVGLSVDEYPDEELCSIVEGLKKQRAGDRVSYLLSDRIFPRLRQYSDNGGIGFDKVFNWELELLPYGELLKGDTFFIRRYKETPSILCKLFLISYKTDNGDIMGNYSGIERDIAGDFLFDIKVCPGVDCDYNVNERYLSSWIQDFISQMKNQKQCYLIPQGIADTVIYSVPSFDSCLSDEVCRILESLDAEYKVELIRRLSFGIANRQGPHYIDDVSSGRLSLRFKDYEKDLKGKGFSLVSKVYGNLAVEYERRDEKEIESF